VKLVLIEWQDAFGCSPSWQDMSDIEKPKPLLIQSVGWLLYDGKDCKVLVPHKTDGGVGVEPQGCGDMTIPTSAIKCIEELEGNGNWDETRSPQG